MDSNGNCIHYGYSWTIYKGADNPEAKLDTSAMTCASGMCGGHQHSDIGGQIHGYGNNSSPLCEWVLRTGEGKGISIHFEVI